MGKETGISWCNHTFNPWIGCTKVSPACDHCYAEAMMDHRLRRVSWGAGEDRVHTSAANWREPLKWDRAAAAAGKTALVFCLSLGDIWDNEVDPMWRREAFALMAATPHLTYLLLSKRIGNAQRMCDPLAGHDPLPRNAALGATMIDQAEWDRDAPKLHEAGAVLGARFTFASVEPMLGPINAHGALPSWVIVGGESGHDARPLHPDWVRSLRDQCAATRTPFHFKQWGEWAPEELYVDRSGPSLPWLAFDGDRWRDDMRGDGVDWVVRLGKKRAGALLDGREHREFPHD